MLSESVRDAVDKKAWVTSKTKHGKLGGAVEYSASGSEVEGIQGSKPDVSTLKYLMISSKFSQVQILSRLKETFDERQIKIPKGVYLCCWCLGLGLTV